MNRVAIDIDEVLVKFLFPMAKYHTSSKLWKNPSIVMYIAKYLR